VSNWMVAVFQTLVRHNNVRMDISTLVPGAPLGARAVSPRERSVLPMVGNAWPWIAVGMGVSSIMICAVAIDPSAVLDVSVIKTLPSLNRLTRPRANTNHNLITAQ
jgi:hypothetical protein